MAFIVTGAVISSVVGADSSRHAANQQRDAAQASTDSQRAMYDQTRTDQLPYRQAGSNALGAIQGGFGLGPESGGVTSGDFNHRFDANDLKNGLSPNYDFQLQQGLGAINNQSSVAGGLVGGNALKGINDYAQGTAASAYQQAFNNYNTNQTNIYNRLSNLAGLGQTSANATGVAAEKFGGNIGSAMLAGGASAAAGTMGGAKNFMNGINGAASGLNSMYFGGGAQGSFTNISSGIPSSEQYATNNLLTE